MHTKRRLLGASALFLAISTPVVAQVSVDAQARAWTFKPGYSASWLSQIGVTSAVEQQANGGLGVLIGFVDTGVVASQIDLTGRVSSLSSCAAVTFKCSKNYNDDNGHGTATAAIGAGATLSSGAGMSGVAPRATILSEKVLNKSGSGYDTDVASGITKAASAGAKVISLSLTFTPTPAVASAINTATAGGAVVVYAGGNSGTPLLSNADSAGFNASALNHLVFVGSVNSQNQISSFSNTPGTGSIVTDTGSASYASLWLMAPGENIIAPGIQYGPLSFASWTGTSMAAPMVTGAIALLEATWPVLAREGTATEVLFATATDLGAPGVDPIYGNGLLNVERAMQPVGAMTVATSAGDVPVDNLQPTEMTGGAGGSMKNLRRTLSNYTSFDTFQRNFTLDLSGLLDAHAVMKTSAQAAITPAVLTNTTSLSDGRTMSVSLAANQMFAANGNPGADHFTASMQNSPYDQLSGAWMMTLTNNLGSEVTVGHGFPAAASFAQALWGDGSLAADASYTLSGATDLMNLAEGGHFMAFGTAIDPDTRIGFSTTEAGTPDYMPLAGPIVPKASAVNVGATTKFADGWSGGLTMSFLNETYGMMGTLYNPGGALDLGQNHQSMSLGLSTELELWKGTGLLFNAALARTQAANGSGLIAGTTPLMARSYGMAFVQQNLFADNDHLSFSVTKPLRVFDGAVELATTTVDSEGYAHLGATRVGINPDGNETDFAIGYAKFWRQTNFTASFGYRQDADNLHGMTDMVLRFGTGFRF